MRYFNLWFSLSTPINPKYNGLKKPAFFEAKALDYPSTKNSSILILLSQFRPYFVRLGPVL
jgi:hypothetical protein